MHVLSVQEVKEAIGIKPLLQEQEPTKLLL